MTRAESIVLLASAGTGKTTRLTNRLLALYASGASPERVLASTFTRKAAGEILERLIQRLCGACESEAAAATLARQIGLALDRERAARLCVTLLRHVDRLRIATLDAWFKERVQRASFELGLPADWDVCDPELERRLYGRALSRALDRPRTDDEWSTLIADLKRGGAESRVHSGLLTALARAARFARECTADAWEFPPAVPDAADADIERALAAFERFEVPVTKEGTPRKRHQSAMSELTRCVREHDWRAFADAKLAARVLDGTLKFDKLEIPGEWAACVRVFARRAAHHAAKLVRCQNAALRTLAADFQEELEAATRAERRLAFDTLPRLLAGRAPDPRSAVAHLLLDEFQDTSRLQWRALERDVEAVVEGAETSFFCVGDVKQSIYAWRDGNPMLLAELGTRLSLRTETMEENFRSSPVVLEFVNLVFEHIGSNAALAEGAERLAGQRFEQEFERHRTPHSFEGCVRLWCGPRVDERTLAPREDGRIQRGVASAVELHAAQPDWKIAFLVRSKKLVPRLIERLGRAGLSASGEGGNPLTDSSAVNAALSLLELADHPADDTLVFHVVTSP
ncbi:MAG TPA: UvrD-helicase domain-containing protein, partial [Planctomycetota bacterium]|nr:UvrD-helicase domain-containing protein [Planctomycetota bacterium]